MTGGRNQGNNPFEYSDTNKRYHTYDFFLRNKFGKKVFKVPLDCGFTCPNIDGSKGRGGCTYCSERGSGDFAAPASLSISEQYDICREGLSEKWKDAFCIPYFQAHTNTYAPTERLRSLYYEALALPDAVGISISTRPDCLSDKTVDLLREISGKTFLTVELGLQSAFDETAERINRCHTYNEFLEGYKRLEGLNVCVHIIDGLPGESHEMMIETAERVAELAPHAVKIHLLHILKGTRMADQYLSGDFDTMSLVEYVSTVCDQIELMPPETVICRVTGDGAPDLLIAPEWSRKKFVVMNEIDKEFVRRNTFQGYRYKRRG